MALTDYVIMPGEDYQAICDAVRAKTGKTEALKSGDLSAEVAQIEIDDGSKEQLKQILQRTIREIIIPEDVTNIGNSAFSNCFSLHSVTMHNNILSLDHMSFQNCNLSSLNNLPESITTIGNSAFSNTQISLSTLPQNLSSLGSGVFTNCKNVKLTKLPLGIKKILATTFYGCSQILVFTFHSQIQEIGTQAFRNCTGLTEINFEGTPSSIETNTFLGCTALTTINVPWSEGEVANAPWGATNATINYNYTPPEETEGDET